LFHLLNTLLLLAALVEVVVDFPQAVAVLVVLEPQAILL
jgi:hypothetical protein